MIPAHNCVHRGRRLIYVFTCDLRRTVGTTTNALNLQDYFNILFDTTYKLKSVNCLIPASFAYFQKNLTKLRRTVCIAGMWGDTLK